MLRYDRCLSRNDSASLRERTPTLKMLSVTIFSIFLLVSVNNAGKLCKVAKWKYDGRNMIEENKGHVTIVYVLSRSESSNRYQLDALKVYLNYYSTVLREKVKVIVFQPQMVTMNSLWKQIYHNMEFIKEPGNEYQIFRRLGGYERDLLIYDVCSRLVYRYGYPYSFLGFPFLTDAVHTSLSMNNQICGPCSPDAKDEETVTAAMHATKLPLTNMKKEAPKKVAKTAKTESKATQAAAEVTTTELPVRRAFKAEPGVASISKIKAPVTEKIKPESEIKTTPAVITKRKGDESDKPKTTAVKSTKPTIKIPTTQPLVTKNIITQLNISSILNTVAPVADKEKEDDVKILTKPSSTKGIVGNADKPEASITTNKKATQPPQLPTTESPGTWDVNTTSDFASILKTEASITDGKKTGDDLKTKSMTEAKSTKEMVDINESPEPNVITESNTSEPPESLATVPLVTMNIKTQPEVTSTPKTTVPIMDKKKTEGDLKIENATKAVPHTQEDNTDKSETENKATQLPEVLTSESPITQDIKITSNLTSILKTGAPVTYEKMTKSDVKTENVTKPVPTKQNLDDTGKPETNSRAENMVTQPPQASTIEPSIKQDIKTALDVNSSLTTDAMVEDAKNPDNDFKNGSVTSPVPTKENADGSDKLDTSITRAGKATQSPQASTAEASVTENIKTTSDAIKILKSEANIGAEENADDYLNAMNVTNPVPTKEKSDNKNPEPNIATKNYTSEPSKAKTTESAIATDIKTQSAISNASKSVAPVTDAKITDIGLKSGSIATPSEEGIEILEKSTIATTVITNTMENITPVTDEVIKSDSTTEDPESEGENLNITTEYDGEVKNPTDISKTESFSTLITRASRFSTDNFNDTTSTYFF